MHHKSEPDDVNELMKLGYDRRDVQMKPLALSVIGFFAFTVLAAVVSIPIYHLLVGESMFPEDAPPVVERRWDLPQPVLQDRVTAAKDIEEMRRKEAEVLNTYGPSPEEPGRGRMPIDKAMERVAERGLSPAPAEPAPANPPPAPGEVQQ